MKNTPSLSGVRGEALTLCHLPGPAVCLARPKDTALLCVSRTDRHEPMSPVPPAPRTPSSWLTWTRPSTLRVLAVNPAFTTQPRRPPQRGHDWVCELTCPRVWPSAAEDTGAGVTAGMVPEDRGTPPPCACEMPQGVRTAGSEVTRKAGLGTDQQIVTGAQRTRLEVTVDFYPFGAGRCWSSCVRGGCSNGTHRRAHRRPGGPRSDSNQEP